MSNLKFLPAEPGGDWDPRHPMHPTNKNMEIYLEEFHQWVRTHGNDITKSVRTFLEKKIGRAKWKNQLTTSQ